MWKPQQSEAPKTDQPQYPVAQAVGNSPLPARPAPPVARDLACLGRSLEIKGAISGNEDLQIDGKVEGPVTLQGQKLTVGPSGQMRSQISAREIVVYGKVSGNLSARDRVEIKKDGSVIGDITTSRISIEDGAYFKGRIEIERAKPDGKADTPQAEPVPALTGVN